MSWEAWNKWCHRNQNSPVTIRGAFSAGYRAGQRDAKKEIQGLAVKLYKLKGVKRG